VHTRVRSGSNDEGETLVELVISVAILGITVVAIIGGVATSILMSDIHRKQATAGSYVRSYAEAVQTSVTAGGFNPTTTPSALQTAVGFVAPAGFTATVTPPVRCWTGAAFGTCLDSSTVQQITLNVASADWVPGGARGASESLVVVVRKP
jgi:type II secretory pathway pseudopilin PulG